MIIYYIFLNEHYKIFNETFSFAKYLSKLQVINSSSNSSGSTLQKLSGRSGKKLFWNNDFLSNLIDFHWIFTYRLQKFNFSNFSIFCIFAAMCKKNCSKPFGLWILIFIRSNDRDSLPRKWTARILNSIRYFYLKMLKINFETHISVKLKNLPEGHYTAEAKGECFAPLSKIILK